ncbi:MAG TPA: DUF2478 domain-containing protein [Anaerolineae bacterium]|nr:DUF2478 domain-containing protein [Anaerolineae bacterium]
MIALLTGGIGIGKTTVCRRVVELARRRGYTCGGLLSLSLLDEGGAKVGIEALDLASGRRRLLARADRDLGGPRTEHYSFDAAALAWANSVLIGAVKAGCDLLVVDEVGPLELERGEGLAPALAELGGVPRALVVVRDALLGELRRRLRGHELAVFAVDEENRGALPSSIVGWLFGV